MEDVRRGLALPTEQGKVTGFLNNAENAQRINGLVEEIREALIDYQVCTSIYSFYTVSDFRARLHYNKIYTKRVVGSS